MTSAARTTVAVSNDITTLGHALQDPNLTAGQSEHIKDMITTLGDELACALSAEVEQEEITAAEYAAYGDPNRYL